MCIGSYFESSVFLLFRYIHLSIYNFFNHVPLFICFHMKELPAVTVFIRYIYHRDHLDVSILIIKVAFFRKDYIILVESWMMEFKHFTVYYFVLFFIE